MGHSLTLSMFDLYCVTHVVVVSFHLLQFRLFIIISVYYLCLLLGRHGSDSLCRDEREKKMAATYNVLAFKR